MSETIITLKSEKITYPELPLAIYREIAAHLEQVSGIKVTLLPQINPEFSYTQSQIGGLLLAYSANFSPSSQDTLEAILDYYQQTYIKMHREIINS